MGDFPLVNPLPLTLLLVSWGLVVWAAGLFFLGIGSEPAEGGQHPVKTVGVIALVGGLAGFVNIAYLLFIRPAPLGDTSMAVIALATPYAFFFTALGISALNGFDLKPLANIALPIAVGSLFFVTKFFDGDLLFQTIMVVWTVAFAAVWATIYGKLPAKALGAILVFTSVWTFFLPALRIALGLSFLTK